MGVTYKLREEVVQFIISQRQGNPLFSCRQLAESASQQFGLLLSKSSVHDVLKESGVITPRGRKPKNKFQIPQDKKKQIQVSLAQVKLLPPPLEQTSATPGVAEVPSVEPKVTLIADVVEVSPTPEPEAVLPAKIATQTPTEYEGAGRVFLKAVIWDLGILPEENDKQVDFPTLQETDWDYYLTYSKGIKVVLENDKSFFIDLPLPLERSIRETADGLINNITPLIVHKVSDEESFKACMNAQSGFKINNISIVDYQDHILFEFNDIVELKRDFILKNREFVVNRLRNAMERTRSVFFTQIIDNIEVIDNILNLKGFDIKNQGENITTLIMTDGYDNNAILKAAVEKLNGMYLRDEQSRAIKVQLSLG